MAIQFLAEIVISIGLGMDILGVLVLTLFSDSIFRYFLRTMNTYGADKVEQQEKKKWSKLTTWIGLVLLVGGFVLQIIGIWMPLVSF